MDGPRRESCLPVRPGRSSSLDPVSPEPIRAENNEAASADNLRSPERNSEWATKRLTTREPRCCKTLVKKSF